MNRCVFCDIVECKKTAVVVHEDDDMLVFMDKAPFNFGHTLIVPKKHYRYLTDMSEDESPASSEL